MAHDHEAHDHDLHDHDRGLSHDLPVLLSRRRALALLGGTGLAAALAGCGVTGSDGADGSAGGPEDADSAGAGIPQETAGPFPGDGSNGVNVLIESGIVRSGTPRATPDASGRWPHVHFEVYPSLRAATTASRKLRTSQLALPEAACRQVYATEGDGQSLANLAQTSLDRDMVFRDGYSLQLATVTGSAAEGMTATLNVPV